MTEQEEHVWIGFSKATPQEAHHVRGTSVRKSNNLSEAFKGLWLHRRELITVDL